MEEIALVSMSAAILSFLVTLISNYFKNRQKEKEKEKETILKEEREKKINHYIEESLEKEDEETKQFVKLINTPYHFPSGFEKILTVPTETIGFENPSEEIEQLKERIEALEKFVPKEDEIIKITSTNDAIFKLQLQQISDAISKIESNQLSRWDVVVTVFAIFTALGGIIAIGTGIVKFLL